MKKILAVLAVLFFGCDGLTQGTGSEPPKEYDGFLKNDTAVISAEGLRVGSQLKFIAWGQDQSTGDGEVIATMDVDSETFNQRVVTLKKPELVSIPPIFNEILEELIGGNFNALFVSMYEYSDTPSTRGGDFNGSDSETTNPDDGSKTSMRSYDSIVYCNAPVSFKKTGTKEYVFNGVTSKETFTVDIDIPAGFSILRATYGYNSLRQEKFFGLSNAPIKDGKLTWKWDGY